MIELDGELELTCVYCKEIIHGSILWQGIHVCVLGMCPKCDETILRDIPVGQALYTPYTVCLERKEIFGDAQCRGWFGQPLLDSLLSPDQCGVGFSVEKLFNVDNVIILICLDYLYGHALLKLLNSDKHLKDDKEYGLVVIVPKILRWMVPDGVAEIWTVDLSLGKMRGFYPDLDRKIRQECERFSAIQLSPAYSHPTDFDITHFTSITRHDFSKDDARITFIWRDDRLWHPTTIAYRVLRRLGLAAIFCWWQKVKIVRLFKKLKAILPNMRFTVAGVGSDIAFPAWIDDQRINPPLDASDERHLCEFYAESRVVIGVHGSNMLLPSAHAGMVVDLMPAGRWGNLAQDILYAGESCRASSFLYRYVPLNIDLEELCEIISVQVGDYSGFVKRMLIK